LRHAGIAIATLATVFALASPAGAEIPSESAAMIDRVNAARSSHGLPALRASEGLTGSARSYARYMLRHDHLGHLSSIRASGSFMWLGENLAWHFDWKPRVRMSFSGWMNSPPHRAVLLSRAARQIGVGRVRGYIDGQRTTAWVAHLGG
jgi:uncharacterized protein YkwD